MLLLLLYADDAKILGYAKTNDDFRRLQQDIDVCTMWARDWFMRFNISKCKVMHVGRKAYKSTNEYTMVDDSGTTHTLEATKVERDLGVLVTDDLKLGDQCRAAAAKARWKFNEMKQTFSSRCQQLWEILYKSHIRPHLEHGIQACSPYLKRDSEALERVQRAVTKHISGMKGLTYEQRLDKLGWTTLAARRLRGDLILTFQAYRMGAFSNLN